MSGRPIHRVLIVSQSDKACDYIRDILPPGEYSPVLYAKSAGEARRMLVSESCGIVIINTPLPDEFGTSLASELSEGVRGVLLLVKDELYDEVSSSAGEYGVFTLAKPVQKSAIYSAAKLLGSMCTRLERMEEKNRSLQEKMSDIRAVNRAKWLLIENLNMSEKDAHYYIEKRAMDTRMTRREVAEGIIRTYDS